MRNLATLNQKQVTQQAEEVSGGFLRFMNRALKLNQVVFDYKSYCKFFVDLLDDRIRRKFNQHMQRKEKAEKKFKVALEKAIMSYAEKATSFFSKEQLERRDIKYLSPPIVKILFSHLYHEQLLAFLVEKHKYKKGLREIQQKRASNSQTQHMTYS